MKRFLTIILLLWAAYSFAESPKCTIRNNSNCTVYYQLMVDTDSAYMCYPNAISAILSLPPGASVTYHTSTLPGLPDTLAHWFVGARIFNGPMGCGPTPVFVGDLCYFPSLTASYTALNPICALCTKVSVVWTPSVILGAICYLTFY